MPVELTELLSGPRVSLRLLLRAVWYLHSGEPGGPRHRRLAGRPVDLHLTLGLCRPAFENGLKNLNGYDQRHPAGVCRCGTPAAAGPCSPPRCPGGTGQSRSARGPRTALDDVGRACRLAWALGPPPPDGAHGPPRPGPKCSASASRLSRRPRRAAPLDPAADPPSDGPSVRPTRAPGGSPVGVRGSAAFRATAVAWAAPPGADVRR